MIRESLLAIIIERLEMIELVGIVDSRLSVVLDSLAAGSRIATSVVVAVAMP